MGQFKYDPDKEPADNLARGIFALVQAVNSIDVPAVDLAPIVEAIDRLNENVDRIADRLHGIETSIDSMPVGGNQRA